MQPRIKCLLSSDIECVLQTANIKAFPNFRSFHFYNRKQSKHSALLSTSQPLRDAALHRVHCLYRGGNCCAGHAHTSFKIPPAPLTARLLPPGGIFLRGLRLLKRSHHQCTHTPPAPHAPQSPLSSGHGSPGRTTTNCSTSLQRAES